MYAQLLLQFQADPFETSHKLLGWSEDMHIVFFRILKLFFITLLLPASVARLDARPTGDQEVGFDPRRGRQHSFVEIDHEIFSRVILSLPLIQEGQLSVSGERMCTILVNRLEDKACPVNVWLGKLTALDMTRLG